MDKQTQMFQNKTKTKQKTPEEIKKEVERKIMMGRLRKIMGHQKKPTTETESPMVQQEINRQKKVEPNVFKTIKESTKKQDNNKGKTLGGFGVFTGNATDLRNEDELKVNKKYQDRVNKVLGRNIK